MAKHDNKAFFKEWLEKLQQESWQLELLISGLALFGIYESQDLLIELRMYVDNNSEGLTKLTQRFFIGIFNVGWKIFFINLLIHVILRGLWIGAIGLRYVSEEIDYDALNYSEFFTNSLRNKVGGFDDFIERLEKICSVLFAYTFLLFLLFFSFAFFIFQIILLSYISSNANGMTNALTYSFVLILYILIGFVVFIDFISLGMFKKIKDPTINHIYNAIFTFYGWTTLTFLYRPLLYNFLDNRYTKRLFFLSIPYILLILVASNLFSNNNFAYYPTSENLMKFGNTLDKLSYEDLRKEYLDEVVSSVKNRRQNIPSILLNKYLNDEDYLRIFLKMRASDFKLIQKNTDIDPYYYPGLNFGLFTDNTFEDDFYKKGKAQLNAQLDSLRDMRRLIKKEKRNSQDTLVENQLEAKIDSINVQISDLKDIFRDRSVAFEKQKQEEIIRAFLEITEIEIDQKNINKDLDCYFFTHSNNDEKGLMCLYPMDSLAIGKHKLYYFKEGMDTKRNRINTIEKMLPFYKVRNKYR